MSPILGIWASQISGRLWEPAGAYDALATVTVPSGGAASITFAGIPTGYKHLQIRALDFSSGNQVRMQLNGDTGANYSWHRLTGNGSAASSGADVNQTLMILNFITATSTTNPMVHILDILDYANTSKNKTMRGLTGIDTNGGGEITVNSGAWYNTSAVNSITFNNNTSNFTQYSQFALYGVK